MKLRSIACAALFTFAALACNPVQDQAAEALGNDPSGERNGPFHRAGQPCLLCHDGTFGNQNGFSVAGTVYMYPTGTTPASGATVELTSADGSTHSVQTNRVGNFYVDEDRWAPAYPMRVVVRLGSSVAEMKTHVGRDGSCAGCHTDPRGASSPGRVYLRELDGGAP